MLLMLTDGIISDMAQTKEAIVNVSCFYDLCKLLSLLADVSYFLPPAEKGHLRNGVANRVPVSCCSGFKFPINYDNTVLFSVPESFPSDSSMIGGRTGLRGGI